MLEIVCVIHLLPIEEKWDKNLLFQCDICETTFYKTQKLSEHMKDIHDWNHEGKPEINHDNKTILLKECDICGNKFKNLINHMKKHEKIEQESYIKMKKKCEFCDKDFTQSKHLSDHIFYTHQSIFKWKCEKCDKTFLKNRNLKIHFQNTHGEKNKIPCPQCGKVFIRYNSISRHIRDIHEKRRAHKCDICHMTFNRPVHLYDHIQSCHTTRVKADTRYECDICGRTFSQINAVTLHKKFLHTKNFSKFKCDICGKYFQSQGILNNHYKLLHEKGNFQCKICGHESKNRGALHCAHRAEIPILT